MAYEEFTSAATRWAPGTVILICPWVTHRDERFFADAERFRPERWLDGPDPRRYSYLPFSAGPRTCIGQGFRHHRVDPGHRPHLAGLPARIDRRRAAAAGAVGGAEAAQRHADAGRRAERSRKQRAGIGQPRTWHEPWSVFARGFSYVRSRTHPYEATAERGAPATPDAAPLWVLRDAERRRGNYRTEEWVSCNLPPAVVHNAARAEHPRPLRDLRHPPRRHLGPTAARRLQGARLPAQHHRAADGALAAPHSARARSRR